MLKKPITYIDFDGNERTEDAYFNLVKHELIEIALDLPDGVSESVGDDPEKIDESQAVAKIMEALGSKGVLKFIKDLVLKSYGVRSEDGRRFIKEDENGKPLYKEFAQTMMFDAILDEFMSDDVAAANFVNAVIPKTVADKMPDIKKTKKSLPANN